MAEELFDFRSWIREQPGSYEADFSDQDHFVLSTDYAVARINFYNMGPDPEVVEFHIENKADGETKFFLHFHAVDYDHATGLFREMVEALERLEDQQTTEVLLCCTVGMTTSFFVERLNQTAETLGLDWSFSAVSVNEVYEHGADKAAILVAPQIGYQSDRIAEVMRGVPVLQIPTAIFAAYDAPACLDFVREELRRRNLTNEERTVERVSPAASTSKRILAIAVSLSSKGAVVDYHLYDGGKVVLSEKVIKYRFTVSDLTDIIDTQVCPCSGMVSADVVGIALPGVVHDGRVNLPALPDPARPGRDCHGARALRSPRAAAQVGVRGRLQRAHSLGCHGLVPVGRGVGGHVLTQPAGRGVPQPQQAVRFKNPRWTRRGGFVHL